MAAWDVVATLKAPADQVLAFAAHHLSLGARHLWLYFDDPTAPAPEPLRNDARVTVTLCDDSYWRIQGKRHDRHQNRQSRNAKDAYGRTTSQWLTHIDVDEFIQADRPVDRILDDQGPEVRVVRLEPFEAMHDPSLADDIFTARWFRGPLREDSADLRPLVLGDCGQILPKGVLSHAAGKVLVRTGIPGLSPRIHDAMLGGERVQSAGRNPEMRLLHFHAQDQAAWLAALPFRLTRGAYQYNPDLQAFLLGAGAEELDHFYQQTQRLAPEIAERLAERGRALSADLNLRAKVANLLDGRL